MKAMKCCRLGSVLALVLLVSGCRASDRHITAPRPLRSVSAVPPPPSPVVVRVFTDTTTGFSTSDVSDADEQIVQFNTAGEVIWAADGRVFRGLGANGQSMEREGLEVQFAIKNGQPRAYLFYRFDWWHYGPPAIIVDLEIVDGRLVVSDAKPPVPLPG